MSALALNRAGFEVTFQGPDGLVRAHQACDAAGLAPWAVSAATRLIDRQVFNKAVWNSATGRVDLRIDGDALVAADGARSLRFDAIADHRPIRLLSDHLSEKVFVLTRDEIFEADLAAILSMLHDPADGAVR